MPWIDTWNNPVTVTDLQLSTRAHNALVKRGITTVEQVTKLTEKELLRWNRMGPKSIRDINKQLERVGLTFTPSRIQPQGDIPLARINTVLANVRELQHGLNGVRHQLENLRRDLLKPSP